MFSSSSHTFRLTVISCAILVSGLGGCGTSKLTNTSRTATEQLLISDAMDRAVSQVNFSVLRGKHIYINTTPIEGVTDAKYLQSLIRQHALACGCLLEEKEDDAEIIMELRAGTSGTDQNDTLFGISAMTIPGFGSFTATTIPEVALAKRTVQSATVKIGIFAYTREGHRPVWQSGNLQAESEAKNRWLLGMGPYQSGDIYERSTFNGKEVVIPLIDTTVANPESQEFIAVSSQAFFRRNLELEAKEKKEKEEAEAKKKKEEEEKAAKEAEEKKIAEQKEAAAASTSTTASAPATLSAPAAVSVQPESAVGKQVNLLVPPPVK